MLSIFILWVNKNALNNHKVIEDIASEVAW